MFPNDLPEDIILLIVNVETLHQHHTEIGVYCHKYFPTLC